MKVRAAALVASVKMVTTKVFMASIFRGEIFEDELWISKTVLPSKLSGPNKIIKIERPRHLSMAKGEYPPKSPHPYLLL